MLHDPKKQLESLVATAVEALLKLPDDERAGMLAEMQTVVFRRAAETYGLRRGKLFTDEFVNAVGRRVNSGPTPLQAAESVALTAQSG